MGGRAGRFGGGLARGAGGGYAARRRAPMRPGRSPSSRGLGHQPFTLVTRVRIPLGTPRAWRPSCSHFPLFSPLRHPPAPPTASPSPRRGPSGQEIADQARCFLLEVLAQAVFGEAARRLRQMPKMTRTADGDRPGVPIPELESGEGRVGAERTPPPHPLLLFLTLGAGSSRTLRRRAVVGLRTALSALPMSQKKEVGGLGGGVHSAPQPSSYTADETALAFVFSGLLIRSVRCEGQRTSRAGR